MVSVLVRRLRTAHKQTSSIGLGIGYSKETGGGFYHVTRLDTSTFKEDEIADICLNMFDKYYEEYMPIRKVSISLIKFSNSFICSSDKSGLTILDFSLTIIFII